MTVAPKTNPAESPTGFRIAQPVVAPKSLVGGSTPNAQLLSQHFDTLAETPDAVEKLRKLVLELAVKGRLLPQDLKEKPAVYARPQQNEKNTVAVTPEDEPFAIPSNWSWVTLKSLGQTQTGTTPPSSDPAAFGSDIPFIKPADIYPDRMDYANEGLSLGGVQKYGRLASAGSILMVCIGTIGKSNFITRDCSFNQQINSLTPAEGLDSKLISYFMRSPYFQREAWARSNSTTISILNKGNWERIPFPLPPFAEQQRIVAKVEELLALCGELEARQTAAREHRTHLVRSALDHLTTARGEPEFKKHSVFCLQNSELLFDSVSALREAISRAAFDGVLTSASPPSRSPNALPEGWSLRDIASLCVIEDGDRGSAYPKKEDFSGSGDCVFLNTKNVRRRGFDFTALEWISKEKHQQLRKGTLLRGDIVFTSRGTIGNVAHYDDTVPFKLMRINSGMFILRGFEKHMEVSFLSRLLRSPQIRAQIDGLQSGSAQPQLPIREFRKFTAKIPPLAEQQRIVAKVDELMRWCDALEARLTHAQTAATHLLDAILNKILAE